jgi:aspartyl-tRNA(Asn)/glutamyl-tRNA(Gln) amidotransferase subunit A
MTDRSKNLVTQDHPSRFADIRERIQNGGISCADLVDRSLQSIDRESELNAFVTVMADRARERASAIDRKIEAGSAGPLAGMIVAVKDNIAVKDVQLTCASRILEGFESLYSATAVERLEAADAIVVGKTNLDEFAMGSSNENSCFGSVRNPIDPDFVPGGSSGGSAAAVAAGLVHTALGSETGGSVRQPAAFTGTVGVKPTYGRVSRYGLVAFASSLDQIGPIGQTVEESALLLSAIAGHDPHDATSSSERVPDFSEGLGEADPTGLTIGVPKEYLHDSVDPAIAEAVRSVCDQLEQAGASLVSVSLPYTEFTIPAYYVIATAEASSNLARYDGARYGFRSTDSHDVEAMYVNSRSEGFGDEVKRRIMLGTFVLSSGYYDAYYRKAQQVRALIRKDFDTAFQNVDLLISPTSPDFPFRFGDRTDDPIAMYLSDIFTAAANVAGIPALSLPVPTDSDSGFPAGLQLMAPNYREDRLFKVGSWIERTCASG